MDQKEATIIVSGASGKKEKRTSFPTDQPMMYDINATDTCPAPCHQFKETLQSFVSLI
jgi:hypothetical protein